MSEKITIKTVESDSTTSIVVSGSFMQRLQNVYLEYIEKIGADKMNEIIPYLKDNTLDKISDPQLQLDAYNIEAIIILIKEIEESFQKENLMNDIEVDLPSED